MATSALNVNIVIIQHLVDPAVQVNLVEVL